MSDRQRPSADLLVLNGWAKGLDKAADPSKLEPDQLAEAMNVTLGPRGELRLRPGLGSYSIYTDARRYTRLVHWPIQGAIYNNEDLEEVFLAGGENGDAYLVAAYFDGGLQRLEARIEDGASFASFFVNPVFVSRKAYFSDGGSAWEIDATSLVTDLTISEIDTWDPTTHGDTTTRFPSEVTDGLICPPIVAYERVFARTFIGGAAGVEARKTRLFWSEPAAPLTWKTTNFIDINPEDGQGICAVRHFADQLVIFKENSMWGISGRDFSEGTDLQVYQIDSTTGTTCPYSVVELEGRLFFLDLSKGIFMFDGSVLTNIGEPIFDYMTSLWDDEDSSPKLVVHSWAFNRKVYFAFPDGDPGAQNDQTHHIFVFDLQLGAWSEWSRGWRDVEVVTSGIGEQTYVLGVDTSTATGFGGFRQISEDFFDDAGDPIAYEVRTGWMSPSNGLAKHRIRQTVVDLGTTETATTVALNTEFDPTASVANVALDPTAGETDGARFRTHALNGSRWRTAQLKLTGSSDGATAPFQLNSITMLLSTLRRVRGEVSP